MAVAVARNSVLSLAGSTANQQILGAFPGGLWVPSLRLALNTDGTAAVTLSPVLVRSDDVSISAHANGRPILDVGEVQHNGKAAVILNGVAGGTTELDLPVGMLPGSGPYWLLLRGVSSNALGTARVVMSAIGVPFEGSTRNRRAGDGAAPAGASFGGSRGPSTPGGGGSGGIT